MFLVLTPPDWLPTGYPLLYTSLSELSGGTMSGLRLALVDLVLLLRVES